ncbi:MAG: TrkA family potassium uptake protein [Mycoplasmataceae bacterium]|nr:TrkA family potassium uptake protein [Mycoplasmataceae bacterium]
MAKNDYCVIGLGRFGSEVANQLNKMGKNVMVLDKNTDLIQKASKVHELAIACDASDLNSLAETGITGVNTVIVAVSNIESSIMICANLRELGHKDIIAKAINSVHKRVLKTMGVTRVVIPEIEIADRIAFQALFNLGVDIVNIGSGFSWVKVTVNNKVILNKSLAELNIRNKYGATIMMIQRQGQVIFPPTNDTKFELGDVVTFMCHDSKINNILKFFVRDNSVDPK